MSADKTGGMNEHAPRTRFKGTGNQKKNGAKEMRSKRPLVISILFLLLIGVLVFLRLDSRAIDNRSVNGDKPVAVSVAGVVRGTISKTISATGAVEGIREADIISETSGKIVAIAADVDSYLSAGGTIARVENDLQEISLQQARAQTEAALAANDKAALDLKRVRSLYSQNAVSESQQENAELAAKAALARLRGAQAAERLAQKHSDDTALRTPIAGRLAQKFITVGKMISPGTKVATVVDDSRLKLDVGVPEESIASVRPGCEVEISTDAVPGIEFRGRVKSVALKADPMTRTFEVEIEFPNDAERSVKSGMFVRAVITTSVNTSALLVPAGALLESDGFTVFTVKGDRATVRGVTIGVRTDSLVEVTSGLAAGDTVVTFGQQNLKDGSTVTRSFSE